VIKISTGHILLTALDHRAATFEKLNLLQPALKDAKEMIELKPGLAKVGSLCSISVKSMDNRVKF
jgi:F-box/TPR repeat protein Pof3